MSLRAKALYTFQSENKDEINIQENEELVIFDERPVDGWLQGENSRGERGIFPASYVEIIRPRSNSNITDNSLSPAGSPGNDSSYFPSTPNTSLRLPSYEDDDWDDWDDWDDSSTVVEDGDPRQGVGANGHAHQSSYNNPNVHYRPKPHMERQDSISSSRKGSMVGRNLNRFSSFVRSGVEAFVLGDVPMMAKIAESYTIEMGPRGPQWKENPQPFTCSIEDPTKQTKFKGIKTYISYRVTPSHTGRPVYRRYKHFDWLYNRLLHKFTVISVPHLPEKQATGRFEEDFIEKRQRRLILWMNHMTSHPVLSQYEGFEHFLMCADDKQWKLGKRRAEKDEMVGAHFMLTFQIPNEHQDLQDVEERVDTFKAFAKKMDDSVMQLTHVTSELVRKHLGGFRKEFQRLGNAFQSISQAFTLDPPYSSDALNNAISHTGRTYENIGEMFAEQPKYDLFHMLDKLSLYQGLLANFPDIIHLQKGAFAKVKESQRMSDEGKMDQDEADGIRKRCRTVGFALQAEMNHFHRRREVDFKEMMQAYLRQQIAFYQRVGQQLERTLRMYDNL
ncbi:sorting nexin-33 [Paramormyrops kingsleyae]|uniref:Sorting nexin n=1 Tax=Paramormyrops kingsleyae TaxID=1676925 RepID=A0A3B3SNG4_9TELE|nr:sorting nexin-33-like isoform X1 [Paramormyrops kingsleyae]XP_023678560.1 sorting nexin-33-like isoform X1 [Paramormyrops kingsleyae]XP_023678561.1 sorting nexin-33-like isoform X1 [Paramormyrops kingsleyae]XP_023678562.1 sorting nexin-33-like isoform X1 [Paramormyrops kingsleyae]